MMPVLSILAGILAAVAVYLLLSPRTWQRLAGIALLGQSLPLLILGSGGQTPQTSGAALVVALMAFGLFLAHAASLRSDGIRNLGRPPEGTP
jgi:ABC-type transport system involved in cytochrome c biogenesis permease subunit